MEGFSETIGVLNANFGFMYGHHDRVAIIGDDAEYLDRPRDVLHGLLPARFDSRRIAAHRPGHECELIRLGKTFAPQSLQQVNTALFGHRFQPRIQKANLGNAARPLRARRERPRHRSADEQRNEFPSPHVLRLIRSRTTPYHIDMRAIALCGTAKIIGSCRIGVIFDRMRKWLVSPLFTGGLNRSTQHFIVEGKIDCRPISQRFRDGEKAAKKMSLWDSWLRWDSLKAIGRVFGKPSSLFTAA